MPKFVRNPSPLKLSGAMFWGRIHVQSLLFPGGRVGIRVFPEEKERERSDYKLAMLGIMYLES